MRYLRPKTAPSVALPREEYLYETRNAGMGARGANRDLFQERRECNGIPGPSLEPYQRRAHHRSQHCVFLDGNPLIEPCKQGIGGRPVFYRAEDDWESSRSGDERLGWSTRPGSAPVKKLPPWIERDRQVLTFLCYTSESVESSQDEKDRYRKFKMYFYLEDDSLAIIEERKPNSGLNEGRQVRRHRIPADPSADRLRKTAHLNMWDINVGRDVVVYGRIYHVYDCDEFTKHFLSCQGIIVPPEEPVPYDVYTETRDKIETRQAHRPFKKMNTLSKFLEKDRKVLRFQGIWYDGQDKRKLTLLYYLADDTVQITEQYNPAGGRYKAATFLRRSRLPKDISKLVSLPGSLNEETVLNVITTPGLGLTKKNHFLRDNTDMKSREVEYYTPQDFRLGQEIELCGKKIMLHDCDEFTREYYKVTLGDAGVQPVPVKEEVEKVVVKEVPPYTGFGSEEDSLTSWLGGNSLEPKPPRRDFFKFMNLDRKGYDSHILRFVCRIVHEGKCDNTRRFVLSYFLSDDTILITVLPETGGLTGGKFLDRRRIKKPEKYQSDPPLHSEFYTAQDFYVGALVELNKQTFLITAADEYVFNFMERSEMVHKFPRSNKKMIMNKIRAALPGDKYKQMMARFMSHDPQGNLVVTESSFRSVLDQFIGYELSEHEVITLVRSYGERKQSDIFNSQQQILALLQSELRKDNFFGFDKLKLAFKEHDELERGKLTKGTVRRVLLSSLGLSRCHVRSNTVKHIIDSYLNTLQDEVDYERLVADINWLTSTTKPIPPVVVPVKIDNSRIDTKADKTRDIVNINYDKFMEDVKE